jgi:hypothetical protein
MSVSFTRWQTSGNKKIIQKWNRGALAHNNPKIFPNFQLTKKKIMSCWYNWCHAYTNSYHLNYYFYWKNESQALKFKNLKWLVNWLLTGSFFQRMINIYRAIIRRFIFWNRYTVPNLQQIKSFDIQPQNVSLTKTSIVSFQTKKQLITKLGTYTNIWGRQWIKAKLPPVYYLH